jgi:hypothetical protein
VTQRDVRHLVRHHARDLAFRLGRFDHAAVEKHRTARQREGIDVLLIDDIERVCELRVLELRWHRLSEPPSDPLDVVVDPLVVQHRQFLLYLR